MRPYPTVPRTCKQCGKDFLATTGAVNAGGALFCSRPCYWANKRTRSGSATPNYKGGVTLSKEGYRYIRLSDDHPFAAMRSYSGAYALEHRLVMAEHLGLLARR